MTPCPRNGGKAHASDEAEEAAKKVVSTATLYKDELRNLVAKIALVRTVAESRGEKDLPQQLVDWTTEIQTHIGAVGTDAGSALTAHSEVMAKTYEASIAVPKGIEGLKSDLAAEPDQSATIDARSFLTKANDRWNQVRLARVNEDKAKAVRGNTEKVYDEYCAISDDALKSLYESVETEFSRYYQFINSDDEGGFTAVLDPSGGSLDLNVDFYKLGKFPPTAYHSEGHQDGMGVCLYLALVDQLLGKDFRYAVLDDVVMSVDTNHRKQFCELLRKEFPEVQFIITTHDEVWARQMQSAGLITAKSQARFYNWTVDDGPLYEQGDIWERIEEDLTKDDVPSAAAKLRRRLEAAAGDIADSIGGRVVYRGDNDYDPSDLINAVKGRYKDLLALASKSAQSWGNTAAGDDIKAKQEARAAVIPDQESEGWAVNKAVHNNDWANFSVNDFRPVLETSRTFLNLFKCSNPDCDAWIRVDGRPESALRCECGAFNLNLTVKKK